MAIIHMREIEQDIKFMRRALQLAKKGAGLVSPNPMVGAVIVKNNLVIGEGYHQKYGEAHAEVHAIESAGEDASGSTLYCTLEPCCHTNKKTPPCVPRIILAGIKRVVIAAHDPNPLVNGKGVELLKKAGIRVTSGILEQDNNELNRFFIKFIRTGLPYVTIKIAQTLDGKIARKAGEQSLITNQKSQQMVHRWRSVYDAVLVGANTVRIDDPELTVRYVRGRNPKRIVLSDSLQFAPAPKLFAAGIRQNTIILTTKRMSSAKQIKSGNVSVPVYEISPAGNRVKNILYAIAGLDITSVLVEGGQRIFEQFLNSALADEVQVFISAKMFGSGVHVISKGTDAMFNDFFLQRITRLDSDILLSFRRKIN